MEQENEIEKEIYDEVEGIRRKSLRLKRESVEYRERNDNQIKRWKRLFQDCIINTKIVLFWNEEETKVETTEDTFLISKHPHLLNKVISDEVIWV